MFLGGFSGVFFVVVAIVVVAVVVVAVVVLLSVQDKFSFSW